MKGISIMNSSVVEALIVLAAVTVGWAIGFWFGSTQSSALLRNKQKRESGKLKSGWMIMPGSMSRVAMLLIVLVVIQIAVPMFFRENIQWILSAGIVLGYGWTFVKRLRKHAAYHS
jgi:ABC-type Fe3+ transport system permease subunit